MEYKRKFLPRVEFNDIILQEAKWNIDNHEILPLLNHLNDEYRFQKEIDKFRRKRKLPKYVLLSDSDNELLVNFKNITSVEMFLSTVKKRKKFTVIEFLYDQGSLVKSLSGYYTNQIILSFFKERE